MAHDDRSQHTRRHFIGTAAATATSIRLGAGSASAGGRPRTRRADVAIVGAGLAGLTAARELTAAGRSVIVLEARDRVGCRTLNEEIRGGNITEVGGEYVGPTQGRILALASAVGVGTFPTYNTGANVLRLGGQRSTYDAAGFPSTPEAAEFLGVLPRLDALAAGGPGRPVLDRAPRGRARRPDTCRPGRRDLHPPGGEDLLRRHHRGGVRR